MNNFQFDDSNNCKMGQDGQLRFLTRVYYSLRHRLISFIIASPVNFPRT